MDLSQKKLSKSEWVSVEIPVSDAEKDILQMIMRGYSDPAICSNRNSSLYSAMKMAPNPEMDHYLFVHKFEPAIRAIASPPTAPILGHKSAPKSAPKSGGKTQTESRTNAIPDAKRQFLTAWLDSLCTRKLKQPNKADMIRIHNVSIHAATANRIFELVLIDTCDQALKGDNKALYSLVQFQKLHVANLNPYIVQLVQLVIDHSDPADPAIVRDVYRRSSEYIERNPALLKYQDSQLYNHQQQLFEIFRDSAQPSGQHTGNRGRHHSAQNSVRDIPKCVLYMAPTGTGKTMSPIGLSEGYRVIFVCVARHVGLALAKSAISVGKRVAFAFGCETADDIRLHYFAAADYSINKRSGGIGKVDNSNGVRVEIMICDVASYLVAMYYMKSFHRERDTITYWDEPTISMDYESHDLHPLIARNWRENQISKLVLSCATLPRADEIAPCLHDFKTHFTRSARADDDDADGDGSCQEVVPEIHTIDSYDCKKTISLLNKEGRVVLPHFLFAGYRDIVKCADYCETNKSLLRYFDVDEIVRFVLRAESLGHVPAELCVGRKFRTIDHINLLSIKLHYLDVMRNLDIDEDQWAALHRESVAQLVPKFGGAATNARKPATATATASDGILLTTRDAHTLTDGPTIFLAEDVDKVGRFYIQQSKIPETVFAVLQHKMDANSVHLKQISALEKQFEDTATAGKGAAGKGAAGKKAESGGKESGDDPLAPDEHRLMDKIAQFREQIQSIRLSGMYVPNTTQHQAIWLPPGSASIANAFVPNVDDEDVREIMGLNVDNQRKLLLILGIGVFSGSSRTEDAQYMEVMRRLAYGQSLMIIIASSDYIYGTNYQFCHGFIGKDLDNMTQQKTIQAIGRIGRNGVQQDYTVRFRDDAVLKRLFETVEDNLEARNMTRLFSRD